MLPITSTISYSPEDFRLNVLWPNVKNHDGYVAPNYIDKQAALQALGDFWSFQLCFMCILPEIWLVCRLTNQSVP